MKKAGINYAIAKYKEKPSMMVITQNTGESTNIEPGVVFKVFEFEPTLIIEDEENEAIICYDTDTISKIEVYSTT